ncbi:DUF6731 family protein [Dickeya dadantii]|uniref:DUF6731 family protein n=1 Tax=Dickeya dadantii TaxID=204038 RepID=UPI001C0B6A99|nr:DUF6731 family protein [Dickeya dadantii]QWT40135.1 hypothetical protein KNV89_17495 [Dickeya dadantii]
MPEREYRIDFFQLSVLPTHEIEDSVDVFQKIIDGVFDTAINQSGYTREIWSLRRRRSGNAIDGQFRKFRTTDIPEIGQIGMQAQEIELGDNDGLIEKNFFVFYLENNILAWHRNSHSNSPLQFSRFLSSISDSKVTVDPILQADAVQRLMSGNITLKKIEFTIPRPTNPELYPDDDYGRGIIDLMNNTNADSLKLSMGVDLRRADSEGSMTNRLKQTLRNLVHSGATTARATVFENGIEYPIDLIADRVFSIQQVETNTNFPPNLTMYNLIDSAKQECQESLDAYFGAMGEGLD